jgi:DNA-binding NarL/FixJ family response regulator
MIHILLVDDDRMVRSALCRTLRRQPDLQVSDFGDGESALAACAAQAFDVGVFDLKMPVMDGVELATRVRALFPEIRVVFVSADLSGELAARARALGPRAILAKPWSVEDLLAAVRG